MTIDIRNFAEGTQQAIGKAKALEEMYTTLALGNTLVFVNTRKNAATVATTLQNLGHKPLLLTGEVPKDERDGLFKRFRDSEEFNVCVCTDGLLGKGVDITKVNWTLIDLPTPRPLPPLLCLYFHDSSAVSSNLCHVHIELLHQVNLIVNYDLPEEKVDQNKV